MYPCCEKRNLLDIVDTIHFFLSSSFSRALSPFFQPVAIREMGDTVIRDTVR